MEKIAVVLHAEPGTHESMGRALHSLLYARDLKEAGMEVKLLFDGGGSKWAAEMAHPEHKMNPLFEMVKGMGVIEGVCDFCIGAFDADRERIEKAGLPVRGEVGGHPDLAGLVKDGYRVITL